MSERERDCAHGFSRHLVRTAARRAPPDLAQRLEEEWLADLLCRTGQLSQLGFALECFWAAHAIASEHGTEAAAATASGGVATARYDWPFLSRRTLVLLSILALHVALIYGLANGLVGKFATVIVQPFETVFIDPPRSRELPPPPPKPLLVHPSLDIPPPVVPLAVPVGQGEITAPPVEHVVPPAVPPMPAVPRRVTGGPARDFPNTDDYYPTVSRRLGEEGSTVVRVCVDDRGRLAAQPTIARSSGSARLDDGALKLARAGSGHYRSSTEDGRPVPSCYPFRITFALRE